MPRKDPLASSPHFQRTQPNNQSPLNKSPSPYANWPDAKEVDRMKVPATPHTAPEHPSLRKGSVTKPHFTPMAASAPIFPSARSTLVATTPEVPNTANTPQVIPTPHTANLPSFNTAMSSLPPATSPYLTVATTQTTGSFVRSTPILGGGTPQNLSLSTKFLEFDDDLRLSPEHMEIIKNDFVLQKREKGTVMSPDDEAAFTYVELHRQHMQTSVQECGHHLDMMLGKRYIYVNDALETLEKVVAMGLITEREVVLARDVERLHEAASTDVVTIHSLGNIVRKILLTRHLKLKVKS